MPSNSLSQSTWVSTVCTNTTTKTEPPQKTTLAHVDHIGTNDGAYVCSWGGDPKAHVPDHSGDQLSEKHKDEAESTRHTHPSSQG